MNNQFWTMLFGSTAIGLGVVFWAHYICWEVEQRRKEAERDD